MTDNGKQMTTLIRSQHQRTTSPAQDKTDEIRGYYKQGLQQIRGTRNMHPDARRIEIARLYATTQAALKKVQQEQIKADQETFAQLERQLWGYDDVRANAYTSAEKAAVDSTVRDAQDRAAKLKKPDEAARALTSAEQGGDKVLARAIAKRAHDMNWDHVLQGYLDTRPTEAERYQQAGDIYARQHTTAGALTHGFLGALPAPDELRGVSSKDIEAMADPGDTGPTAA
ncbi:hypothetical protein [Streptomyces sp. NPDC006552]|uniref:hypothetical protein n=1 Tax=Streptomyces sp. NPDC006552 TaxID=3157179 RepID=UPI0033A967E3